MGDPEEVLTPGPTVGDSETEGQQSLATPPPSGVESKKNENYATLVVDISSQESPEHLSTTSTTGSVGQRYQDGKVFVGGLSWETNDLKLRQYFENFGEVQDAYVSYDRHTGRPRGFGFVVFADPAVVDKVVMQQHTIDRREVDAKKALPKEESPVSKDMRAVASGQRTKKIFVGGLAGTVDEEAFREYFGKFGTVDDAVVMYDQQNRRPRGFGFITFSEEEAVDLVFAKGVIHILHDKEIEIKRAIPRDSGVLPSPKTLYRSPQEKHYGFRTPGSAASKAHGYRREYQVPAHMMGMHPIRGMEQSPMPADSGRHHGVVTGIPTDIVGLAPHESSGVYISESQGNTLRNPHMAPMPPHHLISQGLPPQHSPHVSGRETYGTAMTQSPIAMEPNASFPQVETQGLNVRSMQNVEDAISLVSVSEALEKLSQSPTHQVQQPTHNQSVSRAPPSGVQERNGALWS